MSTPSIPPTDLLDDVDIHGLKVAVVRAALELDLFSHVAGGATDVAALAASMECSERGTRALVRALLSLGALEGTLRGFANSAMASAYLTEGAAGDTRAIYLAWMRNRDLLVDAVRTGSAPGAHDAHDAADEWQSYASPDVVRWPEMVPQFQAAFPERGLVVPEGGRVVDLGCGSGIFGFALIEHVPGATITCVDRGPVLGVARQIAGAMGLDDRATFVPGDAETAELPSDCDVVVLVNVAQYLPDDRLATVLSRMHSALKPGGTAYVVTVLVDDGTPGFDMNWSSGIEMYLNSSIDPRTAPEVEQHLAAAGFVDVVRFPPHRFTARRAAG